MRLMAKCTECGNEQFVEADLVLPDSLITGDGPPEQTSTTFSCEKCNHEMWITISAEVFD